jgi:hypothetical protein
MKNSIPFTRLALILLAIVLACAQTPARAEDAPANNKAKNGNMSKMFQGKVLEVINAGRYAYIQVKTAEETVWVAVPAFDGKPGDRVLVPPGVPVADFQSKKLGRHFDIVYFVGGVRRIGKDTEMPAMPKKKPSVDSSAQMPMMHPPMDELSERPAIEVGKLEKAKDGQTVAEIITNRKDFDGKPVRLRAKVVKFTPHIMNRNWLHVRDGSGVEGANDLIVTSQATVKLGDVVLIQGKVSADRDFGFGLVYPVIVEDAQITVE